MADKIVKVGSSYLLKLLPTNKNDTQTKINRKKNELASGVFKIKYFPSVNSMYILAHRRKILSPDAVEMRNEAFNQLSLCHSRDVVPDDCLLSLELGYYLTSSPNRRDLDNMLKFIIDTLGEYFQFNDNRVFDLHTYKRIITDSEDELLFFRILNNNIPDSKMYVSLAELIS